MKTLDCSNLTSATQSLCSIIGIEHYELTHRLQRVGKSFEDGPEALWEAVVGRDCSFDAIYWFHATRTIAPESFRREGILPREAMTERIWQMVDRLIGNRLVADQKAEFRERVEHGAGNNGHHWKKMRESSAGYSGPFGMLVRDAVFSREVSRSYLEFPELVEDICRSECYGIDLMAELMDASKPCIVKFRGPSDRPDALRTAIFYVFAGQPSLKGNTCYDRRGQAVLLSEIVDIEVDPQR